MIALLLHLVRRRAVKNYADLSEKKKKEIKEGVAIGAFRSIFFLPFFSILLSSLWQRKSLVGFELQQGTVHYSKQQSIYSVFIS